MPSTRDHSKYPYQFFNPLLRRQTNLECGTINFIRLYFNLPSMCLDNIITQDQSQSRSLSGGFGGEKWLEDLLFNFLRNSIAIVSYNYFNLTSHLFRTC